MVGDGLCVMFRMCECCAPIMARWLGVHTVKWRLFGGRAMLFSVPST